MQANLNPIVDVSSYEEQQNIYSVVPNFMFIGKPLIKINGKKTTKTKKLIIWFDIRNKDDKEFKREDLPSQIKLVDFKFQLLLQTKEGTKLVSPDSKKEVTEFKELVIKRDDKSIIVDPSNSITYELDADQFGDDLDFTYTLNFTNEDKLGLTYNGWKGMNKGKIKIKNNQNPYVFNNAFVYSDELNEKLTVLNRDLLTINKSELRSLNSLRQPLLTVSANNETKTTLEITKSEQLRAELERISDYGISYLQTKEKGLKIAKNDNTFEVYKEMGNDYDFQTNKWLDKATNQTYAINDKNLRINFEYNNKNFDVDWEIKNAVNDIKFSKSSKDQFIKYVTFADIKPNTKFDTFFKNRESKLWR